MNLSHTGSNEALETRNRSRDVASGSGVCTRCMADCQGQLRRVQVVVPGPRGHLPGALRRDDGRGRQGVPGRLLPPEHPRVRPGGQGHRRGQPRQGHLPGGRHHRGLRSHEPGAHAHAGLHRRPRLDRHRPQVLGQLRHRRGHLAASRWSSARTCAASTRRRSSAPRAASSVRPRWSAGSSSTRSGRRASATSSCR